MGKTFLDSERATGGGGSMDFPQTDPDGTGDMTIPFTNGKRLETTEMMSRLLWHIMQFVLTLIVAVGLYFRMENRVSNAEKALQHTIERLAAVDEHGTHKSLNTDTSQQGQIDEMNRRVANMEGVMRDIIPKVERIDANVLIIMAREKNR